MSTDNSTLNSTLVDLPGIIPLHPIVNAFMLTCPCIGAAIVLMMNMKSRIKNPFFWLPLISMVFDYLEILMYTNYIASPGGMPGEVWIVTFVFDAISTVTMDLAYWLRMRACLQAETKINKRSLWKFKLVHIS